MEFEMTWLSLLKVMAVGFITYVIAPFCLIIRDSAVYWCVSNILLNAKSRKVIAEFAVDKSWLDGAKVTPFRAFGEGADTTFYLGEREVDIDTWFRQKEHWEVVSSRVAKQWLYLNKLEKRIDRILLNYKIDEVNPARAMRERLYGDFYRSYDSRQ